MFTGLCVEVLIDSEMCTLNTEAQTELSGTLSPFRFF